MLIHRAFNLRVYSILCFKCIQLSCIHLLVSFTFLQRPFFGPGHQLPCTYWVFLLIFTISALFLFYILTLSPLMSVPIYHLAFFLRGTPAHTQYLEAGRGLLTYAHAPILDACSVSLRGVWLIPESRSLFSTLTHAGESYIVLTLLHLR